MPGAFSSSYVLIAIPNVSRAASVRAVAAETLGLETAIVRDGDDAVQEMARRGVPTLLIVDLSLPRVDGFTVVRRLRRQAIARLPHVIVMSAHESLRTAARTLAATLHLDAVLPLDTDAVTLRDTIVAHLRPSAPAAPFSADTAPPEPSTSVPVIDPEDLVDRAAIDIRRRFRMPISIGYVKHGEEESVTLHVVSRGSQPPAPANPIDVALLRQVACSSEPLIVPNAEDHPVFAPLATHSTSPVRGFAAVPAGSARDHMRAALCLADSKPLTLGAADLDALMATGRQLGAVLDKLRPESGSAERRIATDMPEDVKALQHLASTDPLTGIANRRGGERHIASEISRAKREKRPLSCILVDIDRFKAVNDTFGHQAGDQVLRDISALLRRTVRAYDILVRWGGEEFLLVLPGVTLDAARLLAERLRGAVEALDTHGVGRITISAGVAEFGDEFDLPSTLRTADQRLYHAKSAGRNRVI
jgi:diguanylate cyclase (GGDEF)-like protein